MTEAPESLRIDIYDSVAEIVITGPGKGNAMGPAFWREFPRTFEQLDRDDSVRAMAKSGDVAKLYDKWFLQPIPPANTKVNLPASEATKAAWANPSDKPLEEYAQP